MMQPLETTAPEYLGTATYSPDDNKLRLYPYARLSAEDYQRVKDAGFRWAPKQELFVAPAWTPGREDLLTELCGEIGDEDTSLTERAEVRAERMEDYSDKRRAEAERASSAVDSIAQGIPLGQPILVGHHSERHARRDAKKIEDGMRRAAKLWSTSQYWTDRAAGALHHAKYKELPGVRARRIKTLEAEKRKLDRYDEEHERGVQAWNMPGLTPKKALEYLNHRIGSFNMPRKEGDREDFSGRCDAYTALTNGYPTLYAPRTWEEVLELGRRIYAEGQPSRYARWHEHFANRLAYERAMLDEQGGNATNKYDLQPGGRVLCGSTWYTIIRVNKKDGEPVSVRVAASYRTIKNVGEILGYEEPTEEAAAAVKRVTTLPPLCNYPGEGFLHMTRAELDALKYRKWSDFPKIGHRKATETTGAHRVQQARTPGESFKYSGVFLTDQKRKDPPTPEQQADAPKVPGPDQTQQRPPRPTTSAYYPEGQEPAWKKAQMLKDALATGVQVVAADQLFPTPPDLAARMVAEADIWASHEVLEPSAGTGSIADAILAVGVRPVCCEINCKLCDVLSAKGYQVVAGDFLERFSELDPVDDVGTVTYEMVKWDRIVMNPPFENGKDIKHVQHAMKILVPGGRLVAIVAGGPRQAEALRPIASLWEPLPAGTFKSSGTNVNTVLMVYDKPE